MRHLSKNLLKILGIIGLLVICVFIKHLFYKKYTNIHYYDVKAIPEIEINEKCVSMQGIVSRIFRFVIVLVSGKIFFKM